MAFVEDLAPFLTTELAASSCTIGGVAVPAVFTNRADDALYAAGTQPMLLVASADVSTTARGTAVVVDGVSYTVAKINPDGTGLSRVLLEKA